MAAALDGVSSCGSINMRRVDHLLPLPLPCVGESTAASRVSLGSSPARSDASEGAASFYAEPHPEDQPEASAGRSTQMLLAMAAMGGRGGPYGRRPASSYGSCAAWSAGSLTAHRPASPSPICSPVSSKGGDGCRGGGERRDDGDTSSFVTSQQEQEQGRLPTREDFAKCSATPRNIRLQTPRHPSLPDRRANGSSRGPPKFVHKATPARLMRRARSSHNYHGKRMGAIDAVNEWRLPKVSEEADEAVDQKDWQDDAMSSRVSSARDWNFESDSAYEGSNHDGRAFEHSEVEDCAAAVQRMERRLRCPARKHEENAVHAKLVAWKDAQIAKLIEKLNQKEAQIDKWQKNKIAQARHKLTKTEKKLEKQRAEAAVKMQKAIEDAERRADKKRVKKQAATNSRIDGVKRALEEMSRTGRLPWTLAFL
ncbi:hypothetical protein CFC21_093102 [Triticum aestivum]|uniref:Remorin C-terminal domain-containing protein n=3 Tax=Triticinae TaxID=1648030 RepID=A0A9R1LK64_WHEAT|nr:remorin 4.2-like [Aegilops tauschii subsp. strangulata]XP_044420270.1 remorin 4.2-like [Triticum aestivum]KAF7090338.1 hypothetical protein CFC21_093102 [Triticum aestivum]